MMTMDLVRELDRWQSDLDRLFSGARGRIESAPVNIQATENEAVVTTELPGVSPDSVDVTVNAGTLTIRAERPEPVLNEGERWLRRERLTGSVVRTVDLPYGVDAGKVEAAYKNGVLTVRLPRAEAELPKRIAVNPGS